MGTLAAAPLVLMSCILIAGAPIPQVAPGATRAEATAFVDALPAYAASERVQGVVRLWGHGSFRHDFMRRLIVDWEDHFRREQPEVRIDYRMYGTASAVGAVYTGAGDVALLGEEISPAAARTFLRAKGYPHTDVSIATGSVDVNYFDYAHMVFVHRDNPLSRLSLPQLRAVFGEASPGQGRNFRSWGDLGLEGAWRDRPIQPYGWKADVDFALFFSGRVLGGGHRWNPALREFEHAKHPDGSQYDHGQRILDALARDPAGIAISNIRYSRPEVRALPLAWTEAGPYVPATPATLIAQQYPLVRIIPAIVDLPPGGSLAPATREFLRFLLSREGQRALLRESGYLPLSVAARRAQLEKIR
jgi:phosphate transport system substrate-binding protein